MKAYNVLLITKNPNSKLRVWQMLRALGKTVEEDSGIPYAFMMKVCPDNQDNTCASIRDLVRAEVAPFDDKVIVSLIDPDYVTYINWDDGTKLLNGAGKDGSLQEKVIRNFDRFDTGHEAFLAYKLEKPRWVYDDGVNMAIVMDFEEWCWMPMKTDGIYERSKFEKYLRG